MCMGSEAKQRPDRNFVTNVRSANWAVLSPLTFFRAAHDRTTRLWNTVNGTLLYTFSEHSQPSYGIDWSPDARFISIASLDGSVYIYSVAEVRVQG